MAPVTPPAAMPTPSCRLAPAEMVAPPAKLSVSDSVHTPACTCRASKLVALESVRATVAA